MALVCSCGTALPENARFCHHCGKPQREQDVLREAAAPVALPETYSGPEEAPSIGFGNPVALRVALLCASLSALLNSLPVVMLGCCVWMAGAGFLAVYLYGRRTGLLLAVGQGARLGAMTGILSFAMTMVLTAVAAASGTMREAMRESMKRLSGQDEMTRQVLEFLNSPAGLAITLSIYLMLAFCVMTALAIAGGALGAKVLERD